jgi:hypothetical protein
MIIVWQGVYPSWDFIGAAFNGITGYTLITADNPVYKISADGGSKKISLGDARKKISAGDTAKKISAYKLG